MNNHFERYFPACVVGVGALYLLMVVFSPPATYKGMNLDEFGEVPVLAEGRTKPLDTYARITLMILSGKQTFKDDTDTTQPAIKWFLDVISRAGYERQKSPPRSDGYKVFRITNDQVLGLLGLEPRPGFRYAYNEFENKLPELEKKADRAAGKPAKERDRFEAKALELANNVNTYNHLSRGWESKLRLLPPPDGGQDWKPLGANVQYAIAKTELEAKIEGAPAAERAHFQTLVETKLAEFAAAQGVTKEGATLAKHLTMSLRLYRHISDPKTKSAETASADFNGEVAAYRQAVERQAGRSISWVGFEAGFNHFAPFYRCAVLYVFVFVLACLAWLNWTQPLNRAALWLATLTLVVHTGALIARMTIQGRPPVTNLYSSAVFIGWGCVVLCLVLEKIFHNGLGTVVAATTGALTMILAMHLASSGDTLEMMQAVLDTNFWLATHVTCITLGYTATFVAGFLGILYILRGVFTTSLTKENSKSLGQMIYGVICFATFLSFVGTVLGGIWADYSWGRFWGWDPKENGALLIVIINALVLHARWGGMVRERGMAVLALCGNMVTMWSWFGTNQLGVGLHAYGFNNTLAVACTVVWGIHVGLIIIGVVPLQYWRSFAAKEPAPAVPQPTGAPTPAVAVPTLARPVSPTAIQPAPNKRKKHKKHGGVRPR
jgi:ABC-type transport system involved in cytochrome c biogenesis permease subunit